MSPDADKPPTGVKKLQPSRSAWTEEFWDAVNEEHFLLWHCDNCGADYWPPAYCRNHDNDAWAANMAWRPASGRGRVHAFNITRQQFHPLYPPPYVYALVELEEGPLFSTSIVNCEPESVYSGMPVSLVFGHQVAEDGTAFNLPLFEPDATGTSQ